MKITIRFSLVFLALFTSGCEKGSGEVIQVVPTVPIATQVTQISDKLDGARIVYSRSGGFAGTSDSWTVYGDGRYLSNDGSEFMLDTGKLAALLAELDSLGFFDLEIKSDPFSSCADCFTYQLAISYDGRVNEVTWRDGDSTRQAILESISGLITNFLILDPPILE